MAYRRKSAEIWSGNEDHLYQLYMEVAEQPDRRLLLCSYIQDVSLKYIHKALRAIGGNWRDDIHHPEVRRAIYLKRIDKESDEWDSIQKVYKDFGLFIN